MVYLVYRVDLLLPIVARFIYPSHHNSFPVAVSIPNQFRNVPANQINV
jgi:hypothetical protein